MLYSSYIEINKQALKNNIDFIKQYIGPDTLFSSVVKGNAYGHGIEQFAPIAQACGTDHFSVFSADEADRLLNALPQPATIMIMGYIDTPELEWAIEHDLEFFVFEPDRLEEAVKAAKKMDKPAKVHLDLETGMNRTGLDDGALSYAAAILREQRAHVTLQGICTHYAGAESFQNHGRVQSQLQKYNTQVQKLENQGLKPKFKHTACSAAMLSYPETQMDMVRVGILQYGLWPSPETLGQYIGQYDDNTDPLKRLISWKSRIMSLKHVPQGEYIGYGSSYQAPRDMVVAVVPVGYAWGYSRSLSNQGQVLIRGHRASVTGIVNMNILAVDVTNIPDVRKDDEVVLLGSQGDQSISVASFAELSTQLNYELLTRLPLNIPRYVIEE